MLDNIGTGELLVIFLVALLLFGAKRIPEIARSTGRGILEFRKALRDVKDEIESAVENSPPLPKNRPPTAP